MVYTEQAFLAAGFGLRFAFLDLVNSEQWDGFGHLADHLDDPDWVAAFLTRWGWRGDATTALPRSEFVYLRAVLRRVVEAIAGGREPAAADLAALNAGLAVPQRLRLRVEGGTYQLVCEPLEPGWTWIGAQIALSAASFLAHDQWRRLKVCPNAGCRWAFYDETNGNRRRWCNDRTCGNREKVRRYRRRKAGTISPARNP